MNTLNEGERELPLRCHIDFVIDLCKKYPNEKIMTINGKEITGKQALPILKNQKNEGVEII